MYCRFHDTPLTDRDLSCPMAWEMIWEKGSWADRSPSPHSDRLMGEDFERPR